MTRPGSLFFLFKPFARLLNRIFAKRDSMIEKKIKREIEVMLSHELKTPLTTILGYSEIMMDNLKNTDPENYANASQIYHKSKELVRFIDNMITLSVLDFNPRVFYLTRLDLNVPLIDAVNEFRRNLSGIQELDLTLDLKPDVAVFGNERLIKKCIQELLQNAWQYSVPGRIPSIDVKMGVLGSEAYISITDKGIGIPSRIMERVGERFFRVENADTARTSGLGLGIFLVKRIMELFSGRYELKSQPDKGTDVTLFMPLYGIMKRK